MKKLMIAVAAATTLFAVKADDTLLGVTSDFEGERQDLAYWDAEGNDGEVTAYEDPEDGNYNYLAIDAAEVYNRYIGSDREAVDIVADGQDGIYFDAQVQFTASEDAPAVGENDKLVVWLKEGENEESGDPEYTLMVTAGYITTDSDGNTVLDSEEGARNYAVTFDEDVDIKPGDWHSLTIKAIPGIDVNEGILGFTVEVDGVPAASTDPMADDGCYGGPVDEETLFGANIFPSMVADDDTLTSVGFKGTGKVDDLGFYSYVNEVEPPVEEGPTTGDDTPVIPEDVTSGAAIAGGAEINLPAEWTFDDTTGEIKDATGTLWAKAPAYYTGTLTAGALTFALNELAIPEISDVEEEVVEPAIVIADGVFKLNVKGTLDNLWYGLKTAQTIDGLKTAEVTSWVKGDAVDGSLSADLTEAAEAEFYKIVVVDVDPTL